ncbi:hypothetical protein B0T19DRAFT_58672 [Cercophora scortea]|uniref:Uncharacterized protein n=1 Tax=Cercophora scortea TaxID=314031 RepID=A0AAE0J4Y1_9PEZI|nr:hypothetical protein B0T19DRAFT_58672 [Cercophora scortea]
MEFWIPQALRNSATVLRPCFLLLLLPTATAPAAVTLTAPMDLIDMILVLTCSQPLMHGIFWVRCLVENPSPSTLKSTTSAQSRK